jgi:hypothetical protein
MKSLPKGHTSILSPAFRYTPAASTDLRATFARVREQLAARDRENAREAEEKTVRLPGRRK